MAALLKREEIDALLDARRAVLRMLKDCKIAVDGGVKFTSPISGQRGTDLAPYIRAGLPTVLQVVEYAWQGNKAWVVVANIDEKALSVHAAVKLYDWGSQIQKAIIKGKGGVVRFNFEVPPPQGDMLPLFFRCENTMVECVEYTIQGKSEEGSEDNNGV